MTKRILHIIPSLDRSGAEKQLALLAAGLPRAEFDVHVCALTRGGPLEADLRQAGIPVTVIGKRWQIDPLAFTRLERHIRHLQPDLVQTWLFAANAYGRAAARRAGVQRLIASERSVDPWKAWHQLAIDRQLASATGRIIVNSSGVRDFYVAHGLPADKFVLIPNGVPPLRPAALSREQVLDMVGLPADVRLIGTVARLWPQKRLKEIMFAVDILRCIRDDIHLLILGDGPQRAQLERFARLSTLDSHIHFLGLRHDVPDWLPHFDLLWQSSGYEGLPNSVMEAMMAGLPVVASDIPGHRDLIVPGETGYLVPLGDRAAYARYANKLIDDAELRARLGAAGQQRMREHFGVAQMVERHAALYREVLSE